jgi:uncharacterized iron-regulated membrane protein
MDARRSTSSKLRGGLRLLHRWIGLVLGTWLVLVSLSGGLIVFRDEIEDFIHGGLTRVVPNGPRTALQPMYDRALLEHPGAVFHTVNLPESADRAISFWGHDREGRSFHVYADPYTGRLLGYRLADRNVTEWLYLFHAQLLGGGVGEQVNGLGSLAWTVLLVSGVLLWIPNRGRAWAEGLRVMGNAGWRRRTFDLHRAVGMWTFIPLLVVVVTGAYFPFKEPFRWLASTLTRSSAAEDSPPPGPRTGTTPWISLDRVLEVSSAVLPKAPPNWIHLPLDEDAHFTVRKRLPGEWRREGANHVHVDPFDGRLLWADLHSERTPAQRVLRSMFPLHVGTFGGTATRVLWLLLGFVPLVLFASSLTLWNARRRSTAPASNPQVRPETR